MAVRKGRGGDIDVGDCAAIGVAKERNPSCRNRCNGGHHGSDRGRAKGAHT